MLWLLTAFLFVTGFVGILVPALPGLFFIFLAAVLHKIPALTPHPISWTALIFIALLFVAAELFSQVSGFVGGRYGGMTQAGLIGGVLGLAVGLFFLPLGLILGPLAGLFIAQVVWNKHDISKATRATAAYAAGFAVGLAVKIGAGVFMVILLLWSALGHG